MSDKITWTLKTLPIDTLTDYYKNPRSLSKDQYTQLKRSLDKFGMIDKPIINADDAHTVIGGHQRLHVLRAERVAEVECWYPSRELDAREVEELNIRLNKATGAWDFDVLANEWQLDDLIEWGFTAEELQIGGVDAIEPANADEARTTLAERFIVPPFSVLDARQGYWQKRKDAWIELGLRGELGLSASSNALPKTFKNSKQAAATADTRLGMDNGASIFDPVLCEIAYRWFCVSNGRILDPFAGEATKGIVASHLGYDYTGIELRPEQVEANEKQAFDIGVTPHWICGDSANLSKLIPEGEQYDLIFTSPPYYDLEIYSESEKDGSAFETYEKFMVWYADIFRQAIDHLKDNRFLVVKIGEIRNKKTGVYRNFVGDNITCFLDLGLNYYNEAILVTPLGTVMMQTSRNFPISRKLGKTHQNVLVFYKGNPKNIKSEFPQDIEYADISEQED